MLSKDDREELKEVIENGGECPTDTVNMCCGCNDNCIIYRLTQSDCMNDGVTLEKAKNLLKQDTENLPTMQEYADSHNVYVAMDDKMKEEFKVGDIVDLKDINCDWECGITLDQIDKEDEEAPYCHNNAWYRSIRKHVKKLPTMQEYANAHNVYVAMDNDESVWTYEEKPLKSLHRKAWTTTKRDAMSITNMVQKPTCDWKDSLCIPHQEKDREVEKLLTMQEYADKNNVYVAMDKDESVWSYTDMPKIEGNRWNSHVGINKRIDKYVQKPICKWNSSLFESHKNTVDKKTYHTPCGTFAEGEEVQTLLGKRIFLSYVSSLNVPYVCVLSGYESDYNNHKDNISLAPWGKIEKLHAKEYKPYDKPSLEWIGKEVKSNKSTGGGKYSHEITALSKNNNGEYTIAVDALGFFTLVEAVKILVWASDGTPVGQENLYKYSGDVNVIGWDKIEKLPAKKYKPYDCYNTSFMNRVFHRKDDVETDLKVVGKSDDSRSIFYKDIFDSVFQCSFKDLFESHEWDDGTPVGQEI